MNTNLRPILVRALATSLAILCGIDVNADPSFTGLKVHDLYEQCSSEVTHAFCIGYVGGVGDNMLAAYSVLRAQKQHFNVGWCPIGSVTADQMVQAFKNWYDKNPK